MHASCNLHISANAFFSTISLVKEHSLSSGSGCHAYMDMSVDIGAQLVGDCLQSPRIS